jgi:hypothetical protein
MHIQKAANQKIRGKGMGENEGSKSLRSYLAASSRNSVFIVQAILSTASAVQ